MKTILFLTNAFPHFPGEQFLEEEIGYWAAQPGIRVIVAPRIAPGLPRITPPGIDIDLTIAKARSLKNKLVGVAVTVFSSIFWKEVHYIYKTKGLIFECFIEALRITGVVHENHRALKKIHSKHNNIDVVYCYWNEVQAYAAALLKRERIVSKIISRAHGFDVYESRRPNEYMPLKRQFIDEFDIILAISALGKRYFEMTYGASKEKTLVSRLGVAIPTANCFASESNHLNILSVSACIPIKQIDKLIESIAKASIELKDTQITWNHIGDGPLLSHLKAHAREKFSQTQVKWNFLGPKLNSEVKDFYETSAVDIFLNTSKSEGVPVSIMEAMSYGVPTIAPDIGGISELVSNDYGWLLPEDPSVSQISTSIVALFSRCKQVDIRNSAKEKIKTDYNSSNNYRSLVNLITS